MTFPVPESIEGGTCSDPQTTITVPVPTGTANGDLLILVSGGRSAVVNSVTDSGSAWTQLVYVNGAGHEGFVYAKIANGSESGNISVNWSGPWQQKAATVMRITSHGVTDVTDSTELYRLSNYVDNVSSINPPSYGPSWGSDDNLWLATITWSDDAGLSAYPSNMDDLRGQRQSGGHGAAMAAEASAAATFDPAAWSLSTGDDVCYSRITVKPGAGGGPAVYVPTMII